MTFLIDGYNLVYAIGLLTGHTGPRGLERARRRLLEILHGVFNADAGEVTVVFDAARAPPGATGREHYHGLDVRYATGPGAADDLIEELIRQHALPGQLRVVSNDHRIQSAARRRRCQALSCDAFLDWLEQDQRQRPQTPSDPEGRTVLSEQEKQHWLSAFADLEANPDMKELFNPFDFRDEPEEGGPLTP
jgi:predicted RNA-binding protein with PIN domain